MKSRLIGGAEDLISADAVRESSTKMIAPGSVLIVTRSGILERTLPVGLTTVPVTLNQDIKAISPHPMVDARYLAWALAAFEGDILRHCRKAGTTVASIETSQLRGFTIPVAPLPEQRRIVAALEEQLSELDAAIEGLNRARTNAKRVRDSILDTAVSGGLTAGRKAVDDLPTDWKRVNLGTVADIQGGIQKQPKRAPSNHHFPFLRVANVHRGRLVLDEIHRVELFGNELERLRLLRGDLLIVEGNGSPGEIGRMAIWDGSIVDCVHQNHIIRARPTGSLQSEFLAMYWNSPTGSRLVQAVTSSTSGLLTLSVAKVSRIPVPVPPLSEQRRLVAIVESQFAVIDRMALDVGIQLRRAARLRQSILVAAFEGRLVPQDPNDEPASAPIDRIGSTPTAADSKPVTRRAPSKAKPSRSTRHA